MKGLSLLIGFYLASVAADCSVVPSTGKYDKSCYKASLFAHFKTYSYEYTSWTSIGYVGTSEKRTGLKISCDIEISTTDNELFLLKTSECHLMERSIDDNEVDNNRYKKSENSDTFAQLMNKYEVRFYLYNGRIKKVFAHQDEILSILNAKKAILSLLHLPKTSESFTSNEISIHGHCPVTYTWDNESIISEKNLSACTFPSRDVFQFSPWSPIWNMSMIQFLFNSSSRCSYILQNIDDQQTINSTMCEERMAFIPFSSENTQTGTMTNVSLSLILKNVNDAKPENNSAEYTWETSIMYEHETYHKPTQATFPEDTGYNILKYLISTTEEGMQHSTPDSFNKLVAFMRSEANLDHFINNAMESCSFFNRTCQKMEKELSLAYTMDALVQCNTVPCVQGIQKVITKGIMHPLYANIYLYILAFLPVPDDGLIYAVADICRINATRLCILTLSSMVYNYVNSNQSLMDQPKLPGSVKNGIKHVREQFVSYCTYSDSKPLDSETVEKIIIALKAIGNMGNVVQKLYNEELAKESIIHVLTDCAVNKFLPLTVNVESIWAMRHMDATDIMQSQLMKIIRQIKFPVQLRISAYVMLMNHHPDRYTFEELVRLSFTEKVIQVRMFMASFLKNIMASRNPIYKKFKTWIVTENGPISSPEVDINKYSSNIDWSETIELPFINLPVDVHLESNIIYDNEDSPPQSVTLILSLNVANKVLNLVEMAFNIEGFQPYLKSGTKINKLFSSMGWKNYYSIKENVHHFLKWWCNSQRKHLTKEDYLQLLNNIKESLSSEVKKLKGFLSMKMLGHEVGFLAFNDLYSSFSALLNATINFKNLMDEIKNGITYNITHATKMTEMTHILPTLIGLPMNLSIDLTNAVSFDLGLMAKGDVCQPDDVVLSTLIKPSFAMELINTMSVELPVFSRAGLKINTTLLHSSEQGGNITINNGDIEININNTIKPIQIVDIHHNLGLLSNNKNTLLPDGPHIQRTDEKVCTPETFNKILGFKICLGLCLPRRKAFKLQPYPGITGHYTANITYEPLDLSMNAFTLKGSLKLINETDLPQWREDLGDIIKEHKGEYPEVLPATHVLTLKYQAPGDELQRSFESLVVYNMNLTMINLSFSLPDLKNAGVYFSILDVEDNNAGLAYLCNFNLLMPPFKRFHFGALVMNESSNFVHHLDESKHKLGTHMLSDYSIYWQTSFNELSLEIVSHVLSRRNNDIGDDVEADDNDDNKNNITLFSSSQNSSFLDASFPPLGASNYYSSTLQLFSSESNSSNLNSEYKGQFNFSYLNETINLIGKWQKNPITGQIKGSLDLSDTKNKLLNILYDHKQAHHGRKHAHSLILQQDKKILKIDILTANNGNNKKAELVATYKNIFNLTENDYTNLTENGESFIKLQDFNDTGHSEFVNALNATILMSSHKKDDENLEMYKFRLKATYPKNYNYHNFTLSADLFRKPSLESVITIKDTYTTLKSKMNAELSHDSNNSFHFQHNWTIANISQQSYDPPIISSMWFIDKHGPVIDIVMIAKSQHHSSKIWNFSIYYSAQADLDEIYYQEVLNIDHMCIRINMTRETWLLNKTIHPKYLDHIYMVDGKCELFPQFTYELMVKPGFFSSYLTTARNASLITQALVEEKKFTFDTAYTYADQPDTSYKIFEWVADIFQPGYLKMNLQIFDNNTRSFYDSILTQAKTLYDKFKNIAHDHASFEDTSLHYCYVQTFKAIITMKEMILDFSEYSQMLLQQGLDIIIEKSKGSWILNHSVQFIKSFLEEFSLSDIPSQLKRLFNKVDTTENMIEANIPHPFVWPSFNVFPKFNERIQYWMSYIYNNLPYENLKLNLIPYFGIPIKFPWFTEEFNQTEPQTAIIFGPYYVCTFDGQCYKFPGYTKLECTYILTNEFINNNLTILVSFYSVTLIINEIVITVDSSNNIFLNHSKRPSDLPLQTLNGSIQVTRIGGEIQVKTKYGVNLWCRPDNNVCRIQLDRWYYSKTRGLFGTNDKKIQNDFMLPNGHITTDIQKFVNAYEITNDKQCRPTVPFKSEKPDSNALCNEYFNSQNDKSLFFPCFENISPDFFLEACNHLMQSPYKDKAFCEAVWGYISICARYIKLGLPNQCQTCGNKIQGSTWTYNNLNGVNIIILLSENAAILKSGLKADLIRYLLQKVEYELEKQEIEYVYYGLVGFGGKSSMYYQPHSYTLNRHLFGDLSDISSTLKKISFDGDKNFNGFDAVEFALNMYPLQDNATKIFLMFIANEENTYNLAHISEMLISNSITFDIFSNYQSLRGDNNVFGINSNSEVIMARNHWRQIDMPKGHLSTLATKTKGAIFQLEQSKKYQFVDLISKTISRQILDKLTQCTICKCTKNHHDEPRAECSTSIC